LLATAYGAHRQSRRGLEPGEERRLHPAAAPVSHALLHGYIAEGLPWPISLCGVRPRVLTVNVAAPLEQVDRLLPILPLARAQRSARRRTRAGRPIPDLSALATSHLRSGIVTRPAEYGPSSGRESDQTLATRRPPASLRSRSTPTQPRRCHLDGTPVASERCSA